MRSWGCAAQLEALFAIQERDEAAQPTRFAHPPSPYSALHISLRPCGCFYLQVDDDAPVEEIKRAYRALAKECHPDYRGEEGHDICILLNEAYEVIEWSATVTFPIALPSCKAVCLLASSLAQPQHCSCGASECTPSMWHSCIAAAAEQHNNSNNTQQAKS